MNVTLIRADCCQNCKFKRDQNGQIVCTFNPPTAVLLPTKKGPVIASAFPPVTADMCCGRFARGLVRAEMQ